MTSAGTKLLPLPEAQTQKLEFPISAQVAAFGGDIVRNRAIAKEFPVRVRED